MAERTSDRWISMLQSVVLHGGVVALLVYGWWTYKQHATPPAAQTLAIEAVALDSSAFDTPPQKTAPPVPPEPVPPEPEPQPEPVPEPEPEPDTGPPTPTPEEVAQREAQAERMAEEKREAVERKKREEAEVKRVAEQKRVADLKRKAEEKKKADEARLRAQREQELRRSLEAEERVMAARSSGALANWQAQITARIQRAWLRPPSAKAGIDCVVYVSQVPGGEVTNVRLGACNGDQAVRESIESAVYRASPLPPPPDPDLFDRNLIINFKPD